MALNKVKGNDYEKEAKLLICRPTHRVLEFMEDVLVENLKCRYHDRLCRDALPSGSLSFMSDSEKSDLIQIKMDIQY